jgi:hypothetical protein
LLKNGKKYLILLINGDILLKNGNKGEKIMEENNILKEIRNYVEGLDILPRQEVLRYVRGVYDGSQAVRRQYGLGKEPPRPAA